MSDHVNSVMSLFQGRPDAYGIERGGKVWAERHPVCVEHFQDHLAGKIRLGIYPVNGDNSTHWTAIHFDTPDRARVEATYSKLVERGFFPYLEVSRSKGYHLWIFFDAPVQAELAREAMSAILQEAGADGVEIFPKQDRLGDGEIGNYVFLPLNGSSLKNGRTAFLKLDFTPHEDQWTYLEKIRRTPVAAMQSYISFNSFAFKGGMGGNGHKVEDEHTRARKSTREHGMFAEGRRDNDLFHTANCLIKGGMPESEVEQVLASIMDSWGEGFDTKWRQTKIESALKRADRRERNISEDVRKWVMSTEGHFVSTEYHAEARLSTREDKHAVTECLRRMALEGIIQRYGDKRGSYRRVENECSEIDFQNASNDIFPIRWPLQVEKYVEVCPNNVIVVAGEKDAGKTCYLLNTAKLNMQKHRVFYFSSEMGDRELKKRLLKFGMPLSEWTFTPLERSSNFADVIRPDAVNIIDFLEIHDEFYRIGALIKEIYDKLKGGIAIIAIQKNPNVDWGLGGMRSMEKARLYLSLEKGRAKIVSGKNWAREVRPDGLCLDYKLVQGCKFLIERDWYRP